MSFLNKLRAKVPVLSLASIFIFSTFIFQISCAADSTKGLSQQPAGENSPKISVPVPIVTPAPEVSPGQGSLPNLESVPVSEAPVISPSVVPSVSPVGGLKSDFDVPAPTSYFTFKNVSQATSTSFLPWETFGVAEVKRNLLSWVLNEKIPAWPTEKYQRTVQFGRWVNDPTDGNCWNTRAQVLVRDSSSQVSFRDPQKCRVDSGDWVDPYSGTQLTQSRQVQIDHLVPLKHAYQAGAWKWDYQARCLYANFMGNKNHLLSVSGHENMSKGDRAPNKYVPSKEDYTCEYIKNWLEVKIVWNLIILPDEAAGVRELVQKRGCNLDDLNISVAEIQKRRDYMKSHMELCRIRKI